MDWVSVMPRMISWLSFVPHRNNLGKGDPSLGQVTTSPCISLVGSRSPFLLLKKLRIGLDWVVPNRLTWMISLLVPQLADSLTTKYCPVCCTLTVLGSLSVSLSL